MINSKRFKLVFKINYHTAYGESIRVVGNVPALGNWDPKMGMTLDYHEVDDLKIN